MIVAKITALLAFFMFKNADGTVLKDVLSQKLRPTLCQPRDAVFMNGMCVKCFEPIAIRVSISVCFLYANGKNGTSDSGNIRLRHVKARADDQPVCCFEEALMQSHYRMYLSLLPLERRTLNVVTIVRPPFVDKTKDGKFVGVIFEFLYAVLGQVNAKVEIFPPYDGNWGAVQPNGSWNGMIGQVKRGEADIGAAGFSVTYERFQIVDFTMAFYQEPSGILIPPPSEGEKLTVLIKPLSTPVWGGLFGIILFLVPFLFTINNMNVRFQQLRKSSKAASVGDTASDIMWFVFASILQQGLKSPVERHTRILTGIWWFATLIIANTYIAFLVSYLSVPKLYNAVGNLDDLTKQTKLKWTFRSNTAHFVLFKSPSSSGVYKVIGDNAPLEDLVTADRLGVEALIKKNYAFIKERSYLEVAISKDYEEVRRCRMTLAKETFFTVGVALAVAKGNPLLELLNFKMSISINTGLMEKWKALHWPKNLQCVDAADYIISTRPRARKLDFSDVEGAYFLLGAGIVLSLASFIAEHVVALTRYSVYVIRIKWKLSTIWKFLR